MCTQGLWTQAPYPARISAPAIGLKHRPHDRGLSLSGRYSGPHPWQAGQRPVLVVRRAGAPYGLLVDRLLGQQEIVIKPLPGHLARAPGISGAAILGDGQVALIFDPARLAN